MASIHLIIITLLIVCLFSISITIVSLYISRKHQKKMFTSIYQDMKILKEEIKKIR